MSIKGKAHLTAAGELLELITIAFALALFADLLWVVADILENGATKVLITVAVSLLISSIVVTGALYKYHMKAVKQHLHTKFLQWKERKQAQLKHKNSHRRKHHS